MVIKIMWYWHKSGGIDQWTREYLETEVHIQGILIYDKGNTVIQWEMASLFSKCQVNWTSMWEKEIHRPLLSTIQKSVPDEW